MNVENLAVVIAPMFPEFDEDVLDRVEATGTALLDAYGGDGGCVIAGLLRAALNAETVDPADRFAHAVRHVADQLSFLALHERELAEW